MAETTKIAWTDGTFNPVMGCTKIDPACEHCYAESMAKRTGRDVWGPNRPRQVTSPSYWRGPEAWNAEALRAGERRRVFCGSMCDWAEDHPTVDEVRPRLWQLIARTPMLDWLLLTKRSDRIARCLPADWTWGDQITPTPRPNVWLGATVGDRPGLRRALDLASVPARVRFLSIEPLLEDLGDISGHLPGIHWVIVGAESGPNARPMAEDWVRSIRDQCVAAGVGFFYKQQVENRGMRKIETPVLDGRRWVDPPTGIAPRRCDVETAARSV